MQQDARSWTWSVVNRDPDPQFDEDAQQLKFEQRTTGLAFEPTPLLHPTPWTATRETRSSKLRQIIRKSRSKRIRKRLTVSIKRVLEKMDLGAQHSAWARGAQNQHPEQIWQIDGVLTDYQRWTLYRICTRTLNLYHEGWPENRQCTYQMCTKNKETIEHIVWECSRAQDVWQEWLPKWLGHYPHREELDRLIPHLASRTAPTVSPKFVDEASRTIPYWESGHDEALQVIWCIWTTCTQCTLWIIRNREIFENENISGQEAKRRLTKLADFQTQAVIKGLTSRPNTYELGFRVAECYAVFRAIEDGELGLLSGKNQKETV
ncbi:hypothetical protein P3T76_005372 [Phytophthora citrophthora]|uniref:Reverse transcriptase zinc-binding domain-containing protein n=1 Tax=Phytophthora citrophthora TaxID=4793 RepID=A0AAD9GT66_9STRA|nr:hypothetical protein P3T76_005372 [Phytophthora citrophthora]